VRTQPGALTPKEDDMDDETTIRQLVADRTTAMRAGEP